MYGSLTKVPTVSVFQWQHLHQEEFRSFSLAGCCECHAVWHFVDSDQASADPGQVHPANLANRSWTTYIDIIIYVCIHIVDMQQIQDILIYIYISYGVSWPIDSFSNYRSDVFSNENQHLPNSSAMQDLEVFWCSLTLSEPFAIWIYFDEFILCRISNCILYVLGAYNMVSVLANIVWVWSFFKSIPLKKKQCAPLSPVSDGRKPLIFSWTFLRPTVFARELWLNWGDTADHVSSFGTGLGMGETHQW